MFPVFSKFDTSWSLVGARFCVFGLALETDPNHISSLSSSAKPQLQPQLPAEANLQPYCQAQFKFRPSSVQFELSLALSSIITTHPHPRESRDAA